MAIRFLLPCLLSVLLAGCSAVPATPTIWTTADLARAIETNLAQVAREVAGPWAPAGASCDAGILDMSLGADRPPFMPDVAALAALIPGAALTYQRAAFGEQVYTLGPPGGPQATIIRDLGSDGIIWRRPTGEEMELFPDHLSFESGRLTLHLDEDALSIQVGGASLLEFERCG